MKNYNLISYFIYYLSLEPCNDGEEICGDNITLLLEYCLKNVILFMKNVFLKFLFFEHSDMKWIYKKLFQIILSYEIEVLAIVQILFFGASKLHFIHLILVLDIS